MDKHKKEPLNDPKIVNIPETQLPIQPLTKEDVKLEAQKSLNRINHEFIHGVDFLKTYPKSVSFFGSARFKENHPYYTKARSIAEKIVKELGYAVITGGGPGIMEAGNRGAHEAGGHSLGLTIRLPSEQVTNAYVTDEIGFYYFFSRKVILSFSAEAYIFFPGGFGTLDEFFELVTLIQTNKIERVPIILVGQEFWKPVDDFIKKELYSKFETIDKGDLDLYIISDDEDAIIRAISESPGRS
jgi:uncharacterized protein (TIGR00730 family)